MMKLTLTREQIPRAKMVVHWLRSPAIRTSLPCELPGWDAWVDGDPSKAVDRAWADALEDAITEAEGGKDVDPRQPGPVSDADERAFWRAVFTEVHSGDKRDPTTAADQADEALARYRKAFGGES